MKLSILKTEGEIADKIATEIEEVILSKPDALVCLCAGHSPVPVMKKLVADAKAQKYPAGSFRFVSLDEWAGLGPADSGSCIYDVSKYFLTPLGIERGERMFFFDGLSADLEQEAEKGAMFIQKNGEIDVILLGIGINGHIGFNEPGAKKTDSVRVVDLAPTSASVGAKYFDKKHELKQGITIGIREIMAAKKIIVMASGAHKQDIVARAVDGDIGEDCPVTLIRGHENIHMVFDDAAAGKLTQGK